MKLTPMLKQYLSIKENHKDAILFFRMGDFYETFFDDAVIVSKELGIVLTTRDKENNVPLAGVPWHAADSYIKRLIDKGYKVAICEQMEEAQSGRIVDRKVIRVITPGTWIGEDNDESVFIASVCSVGGVYGVAFCNVSSGEFEVAEFANKIDFSGVLSGISPAEVILTDGDLKDIVKQILPEAVITTVSSDKFDSKSAEANISLHFGVMSVDALGCKDMQIGVSAAGALLTYLKDTQMTTVLHLKPLKPFSTDRYMLVGSATQYNLGLIEGENSLFSVMNRTLTPMGRRMLKQWITRPMKRLQDILFRQDAVDFFFKHAKIRHQLRDILAKVGDVERACSRVGLNRGTVADVFSIRRFLRLLISVKMVLKDVDVYALKDGINRIALLPELLSLLDAAIVDEYMDGQRFVKEGFNEELDEAYRRIDENKKWLEELEEREKELTGIKTLKVGYNKVFGYYIEVSRSNLHLVPDRYHRKQTLVNGERFVTLELKEKEASILEAERQIEQLTNEVLSGVLDTIRKNLSLIQQDAEIVASLDVFSSLAQLAVDNRYVKPYISDGNRIILRNSRHPVLEVIRGVHEFIPNDCYLDSDDHRIIILTGPNMAGKSTYLRQVALIVLMAQMGSFVPADEAEIGIVDRVFTRIGSRDELERGQSTFMVEMNEVSNILRNATSRSLVVLDEVGRGTSTYDGLSIAWAMIEYLHDRVGAKVVFATHYHELTALEGRLEGVKNYHMMVRESGKELVFLWKVSRGEAKRSYGIEVARIVGLPEEVILRASVILNKLEKSKKRARKRVEDYIGTLFDRGVSA